MDIILLFCNGIFIFLCITKIILEKLNRLFPNNHTIRELALFGFRVEE